MRGIAKSFLYLIYIVIVGGLLAAIILTFRHDRVSAPVPKTTTKPGSSSSSTGSASTNPTSTAQPSSQSPATSQPAAPQPAAPSSTNNVLSNSGPGDTIGLFVAASLSGAYAQRRRLLRQLR